MIKIFDSIDKAQTAILEGSSIVIDTANGQICLTKFQGHIYAIGNSCPHLGEKLSKGKVNYLGEIVCPWHAYRFNLRTGEEAERRCDDATIYPLKIDENGVYIQSG